MVFAIWMNKRDVKLISTKHALDLIVTGKYAKKLRLFLNLLICKLQSKNGIDISDQHYLKKSNTFTD